jgi:hypothetical protein
MRRISRRRVFNMWAACSALWVFVWLIFFSMRFGRTAADDPLLLGLAFAVMFGVPVLTGLILWAFLRVRHWLARSSKHHS